MNNLLGYARRAALALAWLAAIGTPIWFLVAAFGTKMALLDWRVGFGLMTYRWGSNILIAALAIGLVALGLVIYERVRGGRSSGGILAPVLAILVGAAGIGYGMYVRAAASDIPPIHDITTDTQDPPGFTEALIRRRGPDANPVDYDAKTDPRTGEPLPAVQAEAYPDIAPIRLSVSPETAYETAIEVGRNMGWRLTTASDDELMFEATAETFWYGFEDDISVRVRPDGSGGSVVDARSVSRVGQSDLGANADRLRRFSERLRDRVGAAD
ncbi:DUF1499 domain-containing protein [Marinicauda salina]|uniref:DUF1499 domain-containing protein n=1 Tax=Marinicauda salina TaxID=2135793 RepID=A0A2U2BSI3_9PROT|nr:DUF1499 domain-containing protein [Marinicauda salina]PWE16973.1 DUF1499 domain-containing protein [Marinicauda salina]